MSDTKPLSATDALEVVRLLREDAPERYKELAVRHEEKVRAVFSKSGLSDYLIRNPSPVDADEFSATLKSSLPLETLLMQISEYLAPNSRLTDPNKPDTVHKLIQSALIEALMRIATGLAPFNTIYPPKVKLHTRAWAIATEGLGLLVLYVLMNRHEYPNLKVLGSHWHAEILPMIQTLNNLDSFWSFIMSYSASEHPYMVIACTQLYVPIISPEFFDGTRGDSADVLLPLLKFVAKLREVLAMGPSISTEKNYTYPLLTFTSSAQSFLVALNRVHLLQQGSASGRLTSLTSFTSDQLVRQCKACTEQVEYATDANSLAAAFWQVRVIQGILDLDQSESCIRGLEREQTVSWMVKLLAAGMALTPAAWEVRSDKSNGNPQNDYSLHEWLRIIFILVGHVVSLALDIRCKDSAAEWAESNVVFLAEAHAYAMGTNYQEIMPDLSTFLMRPERDLIPEKTLKRFTHHFQLIVSRATMRRDINLDYIVDCKELYGTLSPELPVLDPLDVCATYGCTSLEKKYMQCGGCRARSYCSQICQRKDWKSQGHKALCSKLRKQTSSS